MNIYLETAQKIRLYVEFTSKFNTEVLKRLRKFAKKMQVEFSEIPEESNELTKEYEEIFVKPNYAILKFENFLRSETFDIKEYTYPEFSLSFSQLQKLSDEWKECLDFIYEDIDVDRRLTKEFYSLLNIDHILLDVADYLAGLDEEE